MKLYLSSHQLGDHPERLIALLGKNKHSAIVMNAGDVFGDAQRPQYFERYSLALRTLGISSEELDLRKFFQKPHKLSTKPAEFGMLWVVGGNTFTLRRADHLFSISATIPATTTKEQYCGMQRNLLAERFHLIFHRETQLRPGYELTVLRGGPKFPQYVLGESGAGNGPAAGTDANGFRVMLPNQPSMQFS
jgi:hypothetical protein